MGWNLDPSWCPSTMWTLCKFDPCGVRPLYGLESWPFIGSVHVMDLCKFDPCGVRPLCGLESWPFIGSVHIVDLCKFDPCGVRPLCGLESWPFVRSIHIANLWSLTLVGSIHFVDWSLDPSWGPFTLWTCVSFWPLLGPSTDCSNLIVVITHSIV